MTAHPTADWTGQQLREAFPIDQLPRYLLGDRDAIFGDEFRRPVLEMCIREVLSAPRSPWQRAYVERVIGSIRLECLDPVIVFHQSSLRRTLSCYFQYYHRSRTHLSLGKDSPEPRLIQPPTMGSVVAVSQVSGLHHRYERRAACARMFAKTVRHEPDNIFVRHRYLKLRGNSPPEKARAERSFAKSLHITCTSTTS